MRPLGPFRWLLAGALVAAAVGTGLLALPLRNLKIEVNDLEFLPRRSQVLAVDEAVRTTFGSDDRIVIAVEGLRQVITDPLFREDVRFFMSRIATEVNLDRLMLDRLYRARFRREPVPGEPYLLHPPDAAWIDRALRTTAVTGQIAAGRSRHAVFLEFPAFSAAGVESIVPLVQQAAADLDARRPGAYRVRWIGRQIVLNALGSSIFADLLRLLPWSFALIGLLFWILFRSWVLVSLAVVQSVATVVLTLAILARLGQPLSLMTAMIPVLITVLGIADEIHMFGEFLRLRAVYPNRTASALAWETLRRLFFPCTAITLTTIIGFASFLATDAPALRLFGLLAGIGLGISWVISVTLVPLVLALVPVRAKPRWSERSWSLEAAVPFLRSRAFPLGLSLLLLPGLLRLHIGDGWTHNFRPDHPVVEDVHWFEKESVGIYQFDLMLTRRDSRSWSEPQLLAALSRLQREVAATPSVTASISIVDLVLDRAWELGDPAAQRPPIPASRLEVTRVLETYRIFNEQPLERLFLDRDEKATRLMFGVSSDDYATATRVHHALAAAARRHFPSREVTASIGGSAERGAVLIESIVTNQGISVGLSLVVSLLALGFTSGRWGLTLKCIAANVWALLLTLGAAGWLGIEMGVATSSFLALGVGVGLDYGIHLAFDRESVEGGPGAVFLRVAANVLVVGTGLAVLMLSANPTVAKLGFLIVLSLVASGYTAIVIFARTRRARDGGGTAYAAWPTTA
ncbi:MAG TPA: hypothetical protein VN851_21465 [Thermoanaerobaculia bacterium]|nr:hypothetical protein [Thermoanaerobaculia bacterium]